MRYLLYNFINVLISSKLLFGLDIIYDNSITCYHKDIDMTKNKYLWYIPRKCSQLLLSDINFKDNDFIFLFTSLNNQEEKRTILALDISSNKMSVKSSEYLAQFIRNSPQLSYLSIGNNLLNEVNIDLLLAQSFIFNLAQIIVFFSSSHILDGLQANL